MKKSLIWLLAVIITLAASVYQRMTGPTNPKKAEVQVNGQVYRLKLVRSLGLDEQPVIRLAIYDSTVSARLYYKRFKTSDDYTETEFKLT
ncbi:MAG: hypothetical protein KBG40_07260 [Bacteroidales bacterium]|nr:hypothetical protein [Bacteroidales bacterium]